MLYCTYVFIWHQAIHSTYKMTPTYVRYMLQVFFVCFSLFYIKFLGILCKVLHLASVKLSMVK